MQDLKGQKIGQFELLERLGRGGMAEVYRAYQPSMDRFVAIKIMLGHLAEESEDFIERFKREAQEVGKLRHPHIVQVFDFGVQDDMYYMVMEFIKGGTLKAYIRRKNGLPPREALTIASQIADALQYAHNAGMVHRDLKPANIMFIDDTNTHSVLTDFGIARILGKTGLTASGAMVGTPAYMSPEVGRGKSLDHRADLYGLGVILYEMLAGRVPYDADTPLAVIMQHANAPLPSRHDFGWDIPENLEHLILRALAKEPENRYQNAGEMRAAINDTLTSLPGDFVPQPRFVDKTEVPTNRYEPPTEVDVPQHVDDEPTTVPPQRTPRVKSRHPREGRSLRIPLALASLVVVAVLALAAVFILAGGSEDDEALPTAIATPAPELGLVATEVGLAPSPVSSEREGLAAEEEVAAAAPPPAEEEALAAEEEVAAAAPAPPPADQAPRAVGGDTLSGFNPIHDEVERLILAEQVSEGFAFLDNLLADNPESIEGLAARSALFSAVGDYESAQIDAQTAIDLAPDNPLGYYMLNDALRSMGDEESLHRAMEAAFRAMDLSGEGPQALWRLAATANDLGDWPLHQEMLTRSLEVNPSGVQFLIFAAESLYFDQRYEESLPYLHAWYESGFEHYYARELLGGALIQAGQIEDAMNLVRDTEKVEAYEFSQAAYIAYRAGEFDLAREWAQNALALEPDYQQARYTLGLIAWYADSQADAAAEFLQPLMNVPFDGSPYHILTFGHAPSLDLARIYAQAGRLDEAADLYQFSAENYPDIYTIWQEYAHVRFQLEQPDEAAQLYRTAYEVMYNSDSINHEDRNRLRQQIVNLTFGDAAADVSNPPVDENLPPELIATPLLSGLIQPLDEADDILIHQGLDAAIGWITGRITENPEGSELYAVRAWMWLEAGNYDQALEDAETAIRLGPDNVVGHLARSDVMAARNNMTLAQQSLEDAHARQPDHPEAVWRAAVFAWYSGDIDAAIRDFLRAEEMGAAGFRYASQAGAFWWDIGDWERALPLLKTDLYVHRNMFAAAHVMGAMIQLNQVQGALDLALRLTPLADRDPARYDVLAYAAYRAGDLQRARAWTQVALAFWPENHAALYMRGLLAWNADGNLDEAIAIIDSLRETDYQSELINPRFGHEVNWERARIFAGAGDLQAALTAYDDTLYSLGEVPFILAERADVNIALGNIDAARDDLRSAYEISEDPAERERLLQRLTDLGE